MASPRESSRSHPQGDGTSVFGSHATCPPNISGATVDRVEIVKAQRPRLSFGGRDGASGSLEKEAEDIHGVQNAMVLLYAVIHPDSAENKKEEASTEKVLATLALLAGKGKKKKNKGVSGAMRKFKKVFGKPLRGGEDKPEIFACKRGCGFKGEFDGVEGHEEKCRYVRGDIVGAAIGMMEIKHPFRDRVRTCVLHEIIPLIPAPSEKEASPFK